jgi:aminoglycoside phosphotransferase (APT) family kinase protein
MEDLGWICVYSWRFGADPPVGGFGRREDLFAGYEAASGRRVDPAHVRWWEIFGSLRWGIVCKQQAWGHLTGYIRSVEHAAIGRRSSETEIDLLNLILVEEGL